MSTVVSEIERHIPKTKPVQFKTSNQLGKTNAQKEAIKETLNKIDTEPSHVVTGSEAPIRVINAYKYQTITFKDVDEFKSFYNKNYDYINKISTRGLNILYQIPGYKLGRKHGEIVLLKTQLKQGTFNPVNGFKSHPDNEIDVNDMIDTWAEMKFEDNKERQRHQDIINEATGNASGFKHDIGNYNDVDIDEVLDQNPKAPCTKAYAVGLTPPQQTSEYDEVYRRARMASAAENKWMERRIAAGEKYKYV